MVPKLAKNFIGIFDELDKNKEDVPVDEPTLNESLATHKSLNGGEGTTVTNDTMTVKALRRKSTGSDT